MCSLILVLKEKCTCAFFHLHTCVRLGEEEEYENRGEKGRKGREPATGDGNHTEHFLTVDGDGAVCPPLGSRSRS